MSKNKREHLAGAAAGAVAGIGYGAYSIFARYALELDITRATVLFLRFAGCVIIMWSYILITHKKWRLPLSKALCLIGVGAFVYSSMSAVNLAAIQIISGSLAGLILGFHPVFVLLFLLLTRKESMSVQKAVSLTACIAGLALILNISDASFSLPGIMLAFCASLLYTAYVILGNFLKTDLHPVVPPAYIMLGVVLVYGMIGFLSRDISLSFPPAGWAIMSGMASISTALPILLFWYSIEKLGAVKTCIISSIEPLVTILLELVIFGQHLTALQLAGTAILLAGIVVIQLKPS